MTMDAMDLYFNLVGLAAGIYCLYTWFKLKKLGKLFPNQLLVPKDAKPEDCLDEQAYLKMVSPCLLFGGLIWGLTGAVGMADSQWHFFSEAISSYYAIGSSILCVLEVVIYLIVWLRAKKLYWVV